MRYRVRRFWVGVLVAIAMIATLFAGAAYWARDTIYDEDNFVDLAGEIVSNEAVINEIASVVTDQIFVQPQVEQAIVEVIPDPLKPFQGAIITGAKEGLKQGLLFVIATEFVQNAFDQQLRKVHTQITTGQSVTFGLDDVGAALSIDTNSGLLGDATSLIPDSFTSITVLTPEDAPWLYRLLDLLDGLWFWLALIVLAAYIAAIAVSRQRRKTVYSAAMAVAVGAIVMIIGIQIARAISLGALPSTVNQSAAETIIDLVISGLRGMYIWMAIIAFVIFAISLSWGKLGLVSAVSSSAKNARRSVRERRDSEIEAAVADGAPVPSRWERLRGGAAAFFADIELADRAESVADYVDGQIRMLRGVGVIVGALLVLLWPGVTVTVVTVIAALVILYIGALEIIGGRADESLAIVAVAESTKADAEVTGATEADATVPVSTKSSESDRASDGDADEAQAKTDEVAAEPQRLDPQPDDYSARLDLLTKLFEIRETGALTDKEYRAEKSRVLGT